MNGREQVAAARVELARAREADEQLRGALATASVWLTLAADALDVDDNHHDEGESPT